MKKIIISIFFIFIVILSTFLIKEKEVPTIDNTIKVEIKGSVKRPGVYQLKENSRVQDLIDISGGLTKEANISIINLSKKLEDEMVIIIYNQEEIKEMVSGNTSIKYIEKECVCPILENDGCFNEYLTNEESIINETGKIALNTATFEELLTLPGIGNTKANDIIKYREEIGGFKNIEEIMNIKGIGKATYEKFKDYLTL
ncbi:MAG: ComEA family DNA-binding protein [Bacilli bacterium]|nr:ComEA family DNA-binding protein [Bacilli bacterium]MDD4808431.1 ComEA family DNA-binding protein [Bacilli bacterium]